MIINQLKYFTVCLLISLLASCSYNDLTNLWPSGDESEEEIVIREIPGESFDPEDAEEITITEIEETDVPDVIDEIEDTNNENSLTKIKTKEEILTEELIGNLKTKRTT